MTGTSSLCAIAEEETLEDIRCKRMLRYEKGKAING